MKFLPKYQFYKSKQFSKYNSTEFQFEINNGWTTLFELSFDYTTKCDHAGFRLTFCFAKLIFLHFSCVDTRHWDEDNNRFKIYD